MDNNAIDGLRQSLPNAFEDKLISKWPDEILEVDDGNELWGEIEEDLFSTLDDFDPLDDILDQDLLVETPMGDDEYVHTERHPYGPVGELSGRLRDHFGNDWPGAPGNDASMGIAGPAPQVPSPDVLAFYLPWHIFDKNLWGIYLLVEGVDSLGADIHAQYPQILSKSDARRAAKLFLYYHEAYHNAVETFAARVEVSHRMPCYLTGIKACSRMFLPVSGLHEEGLANVYAIEKLKNQLFNDDKLMGARRKKLKRSAAAAALRRIFRRQPAQYAAAERILGGLTNFEFAEAEFLEESHNLSSLNVPQAPPNIWLAALRSTHPSLSRNKRYSYVISKNHPVVRRAANVPQYSRREVVRRLQVALQVTEDGGGKHPKIVLRGGKKIPVPSHRDLARGTIRSILRMAEIPMTLDRFMGASDAELRLGINVS